MIRYVHGSQDSTDLDVVYVMDELPPFVECQRFCSADPLENRNIIVIRDGIVAACFKGLPDEVNNALLATWPLHAQTHPLLITRRVERDVFLKDITATRKLLSALTGTSLRAQIKAALRGGWPERIAALAALDLTQIDFDHIRGWRREDLLKSMAFQVGQALGLHRGAELYTKAAIAGHFPALKPYLQRSAADAAGLQEIIREYAAALARNRTVTLDSGLTRVVNAQAVYDIHTERRIG